MKTSNTHCQLCERQTHLTFHHLIPRKCHSKNFFKRRFDKKDMKSRGIDICRDCHNFIHKQVSEIRLGKEFNTLESLQEAEWMQKFVAWVVKKK